MDLQIPHRASSARRTFGRFVARVRHVHEWADALLVAFGREQYHSCLRFRNSQFDPPPLLVERLIGDDRESKFVGVKMQRAILVGDRSRGIFETNGVMLFKSNRVYRDRDHAG